MNELWSTEDKEYLQGLTDKLKAMVKPSELEPEPIQLGADGNPIITYNNVMHCEKCGDSGFVDVGDRTSRRCECDAKRKTLIALKKSGLEDALKEYKFENFKRETDYQKRMYDLAQLYIGQNEYSFFYAGGYRGAGKTHIGTAISGCFIDQGKRTLYTIFDVLMNELKAHLNDEDYADVLNKYGSVEVLYIDDFMKFDPTKADIKQAFDLINLRYLKKNRTIITSERFLDEIIAIDGALGGRIKQRSGPYVISITRDPSRDYRINQPYEGLRGIQ
jgi:DNA replication protein DnaC